MKNILEIINLAGSARNFIGDQFSYLQENGDYKMHLICTPDEEIFRFADEQKIEYYPVALNRQITPLADVKAFYKICKYISSNHIDIVICHQAKARTLAIPAAWILGVKHRIIFSHGVLHETMHGFKRFLVLNNDRLLSRMATEVVCVSKHVKNSRIRDRIDKPQKQIIIWNGSCNGIDTKTRFNPSLVNDEEVSNLRNRYGISDTDFVIGFCGRLVKDKGIAELADGFKLLTQRHPDRNIKLLIIGIKENRDSISPELFDSLSSSPNVVFSGHVPYDNMGKYYMLMNVFVFPSHRDGLGLAPLEAQAMKVPALVSRLTGCAETIRENVTGNYIELDGESICREVEKFFNPDRVTTFGENGRSFVIDNFEHTVFLKQLLKFLDGIEGQ